MKRAKDLTVAELRDFVQATQYYAFGVGDLDENRFNPDKELGADFIESMLLNLDHFGLSAADGADQCAECGARFDAPKARRLCLCDSCVGDKVRVIELIHGSLR